MMGNCLRSSAVLVLVGLLILTAPVPSGPTGAASATKIQEGGRYPKYNATVGKVAFDMRSTDFGNIDLYVMGPDGTGVQRIIDSVITDRFTGDTASRHKGQPSWYPDGEYIIFTAEQDGYSRNSPAGYVEQPGLGRNNNVWIMKADGSHYWKLTEVQENGAHIRPSFSHDGTKVMWNEEYSMEMDPAGCSWRDKEPAYPGWEYCNFRIVWGDFKFVDGVPQVTNIHRIEFFDEEGWRKDHMGDNGIIILEAQGFSRDDERIIFSACNPYEVWQETGDYSCRPGGDLYTTDLEGTELVRLTRSVLGHEENAEYSPDGTRIIYTRTADLVGVQPEWYVMQADGGDYPGRRITFFTDLDNPDYIENVFGGEGDWLDERTVILNAPYWRTFGWRVYLYSDIYLVDVPPAGPMPTPSDTPGEVNPSDYVLTEIENFLDNAARVDWSPDGEWIAYDRRGPDGFWDVYRIHPDGTGNECLTCDHPELPNRHQGNPAYHPSGRWLVFQAEQPYHYTDSIHRYCEPGAGVYNELWLLDLETDAFYKLNTVNRWLPAGGSLHPQFSHDGMRLLWGDFQGGGGGEFGDWRIAVADFVATPVPHLENVTYYEPGERKIWYETHGWSLDDSKVLITAAALAGQDDRAMDIYWMDLSTQELIRLTETSGLDGEPAEWDEHAHLSPRGDAIAWMSSSGYGIITDPNAPVVDWLRCELWLMNPDGSGKRRATYFNEPGWPEFTGGRACVSDMAWSPDGTRLAMRVQFPEGSRRDQIWIVEFSVGPSSDHDRDYCSTRWPRWRRSKSVHVRPRGRGALDD